MFIDPLKKRLAEYATDVDTNLVGHSYLGDERAVSHDMFDLIRYDLGPDHRFGLVS